MADFPLPDGKWIRLQDAVEFWASHVKQMDVPTPGQGPSDAAPVFADDAWSDYPPIKGDPTLTAAATDFNIRLSRSACSERVSFKGKRDTNDVADYVRIPPEYFVAPQNFISETGNIEPLSSGTNEEEEILAHVMLNGPIAWYDVLVNRDEFFKWFKGEFSSHVDALKSEPEVPPKTGDTDQPSRKQEANKGMSEAIQQAVKEIWPSAIPPGLRSIDRNDKINEWLCKKSLRKASDRAINRALTGK